MSVGVQFKLFLKNSPFMDPESLKTAAGIGLLMFFIPVWGFIILNRNRKTLDTQETRDKYQNLYNDVHLTRSTFTIYYWPVFMIRKLIFVIIPVLLHKFPGLQL